MSNAIATITVFPWPKGKDLTQTSIIRRGTIAFSGVAGAIYPVGGFPLNWNSVLAAETSSSGASSYAYTPSSYTGSVLDSVHGTVVQLPTEVDVWSAGNPPSGYTYVVDRSVGNLHIMVPSNGASGASGPMVEYGGTLITAQYNDVVQFCACFPADI
jgi:hypothetical protein